MWYNSFEEICDIERNRRQFILTQKVYDSFGNDTGYIKDKMVDYIRGKRMILEYIDEKGYIVIEREG